MTEKRYEFLGTAIRDIVENEEISCNKDGFQDVCDLLNEQHEQINTLRESRRELISANNEYRMRETELAQELSTLVDENEQLKSDLKYWQTLAQSLAKKNNVGDFE